jgi:hypothetical protein
MLETTCAASEPAASHSPPVARTEFDLFGPVPPRVSPMVRRKARAARRPRPHLAGSPDPRMRELVEMGMPGHWLAVARIVGYDAFVQMWRYLSSLDRLREDMITTLTLRNFRTYEKYQRNRYIETLARSGLRPAQIRQAIKADLDETLSLDRVEAIVKDARLRR